MKDLNELSVPVTLEKQLGENVNLTAWLFTRQGQLIQQVPVSNSTAEFKNLQRIDTDQVRILITPDVTDQGIDVRTIKDIERFKPYEPVLQFEKDKLKLLPIPGRLIDLWQIRFCRVIGKVKKDFFIDGQNVVKPLCKARVHICEVDKVFFWLDKIPDPIILRIPDIILKPIKVKPFPIPDPGPLKFPINPIIFNPVLVNPRLQNLKVRSMAPTPPSIDPQIKQQLQTRSVPTIKAALLKNFETLHPYFCTHPWIWPWLYRCDEIKTVYTDSNGRFDTSIIYWATGDKPDLYFWVEYLINGVWTTVYKPPIPCNTYWDYACGTEVTINVSDARVRAGCNEIVPGDIVWVRAIGSVSIRNIKQNDTDLTPIQGIPWHRVGLNKQSVHDINLTDHISPFATRLQFITKFGSGLPNNSAKYFRWKARKLLNADLSPYAGGMTRRLGDTIAKPYYIEYVDSSGNLQIATKYHTLGPVAGTDGLNLIPPVSPFNWQGETNASAIWQYADTVTANFDSSGFDGDGLYQFTLELFDQSGNKIFRDPVIYKMPKENNSGESENATNEFLSWDSVAGTTDFKMLVRIDNTDTEGSIHDVQVNANVSGPCGFIKYTNANVQQVRLSFQAHHDNNFATFSFNVIKGNNTEACPGDTSGFVFSPTTGFSRSGEGEFVSAPMLTPAAMLGSCTKGAFAETLHVRALHTDGYARVSAFDSGDTNAFALEP